MDILILMVICFQEVFFQSTSVSLALGRFISPAPDSNTVSDPWDHKPLKLPSFFLLFQLIISCEFVSPFNPNLIFFFTVVLWATIMSFKPSLVSLCFPYFNTHSLVSSCWWISGAYPDWFSYLFSLPSGLQTIFLPFLFCSILVYLEIRDGQEVSVLQKQSCLLSFH